MAISPRVHRLQAEMISWREKKLLSFITPLVSPNSLVPSSDPVSVTQPPPPAAGVQNSSWNNRASCQERWGNIWSKPQAGFTTPLFPGPQPLRETLSSAAALRAAFQTRPRAFQTSKSAGNSQRRANAMCTGASDVCWLPSRLVFWRLTEIEWDTSGVQGIKETLKIQWPRITNVWELKHRLHLKSHTIYSQTKNYSDTRYHFCYLVSWHLCTWVHFLARWEIRTNIYILLHVPK